MELSKFIIHFSEQFEDTDSKLFTAETKFRELEEWSSLIALSLIAMSDEEYHVTIKGDDIRNCDTINDFFEIVKSRI